MADGIEALWPGHLVGGANATELDWHDETEDPRTNENAINWDSVREAWEGPNPAIP